jgi:hypothetical protein
LEGPSLTLDLPLPRGFDIRRREDRCFAIYGKRFPCFGWTGSVGNWCWDGTRMAAVEILALVEHLRAHKWTCTEADSTFFDAYRAGHPITPALLDKALTLEDA